MNTSVQTTAGKVDQRARAINSGATERTNPASNELPARAIDGLRANWLINAADYLLPGLSLGPSLGPSLGQALGLSLPLSICILLALFSSSNAHGGIPEGFDPISLYGSTARYAISRNQKRIGNHTISFTNTDQNTLEVSIDSKLKVTLLGIPVYRFNYSAQEKWHGAALHSVTATTTEKGMTRTVSMQRQGAEMRLTNAVGEMSIETLEHSSNHWNPAVLESLLVFNTLSGKANKVSISKVGRDVLQINNVPTPATHYQYTGELNVDVWYDDQQRWLKLAFKADDGSAIAYLSEGFTTE